MVRKVPQRKVEVEAVVERLSRGDGSAWAARRSSTTVSSPRTAVPSHRARLYSQS